jgi:hypothetical protein
MDTGIHISGGDQARSPSGGELPPTRARRWVGNALIVALIATAFAVGFWWRVAWVPAMFASILFLLHLRLSHLEWRAQHHIVGPDMRLAPLPRTQQMAERKIAAKTVMAILVSLMAMALLVAAALFDWRSVGIGALMVFCFTMLFGLPVWAATVAEEVEAERDQDQKGGA